AASLSPLSDRFARRFTAVAFAVMRDDQVSVGHHLVDLVQRHQMLCRVELSIEGWFIRVAAAQFRQNRSDDEVLGARECPAAFLLRNQDLVQLLAGAYPGDLGLDGASVY